LNLENILEDLQNGKISIKEAKKLLSLYSVEKINNTMKLDIGRTCRRSIPEIIYAEPKQFIDIKKATKKILEKSNSAIISRLKKLDYDEITKYIQKNKWMLKTGKNTTSVLIHKNIIKYGAGRIGILTAGTADIGVAEEARLMCEAMNCECICDYDVGVAGIHRLFPAIKKIIKKDASVIIVVAGMDGALASVVSSLVNIPVIGVPTSIGYGYGKNGMAALASMLQSCSPGLAVVNIDNGIGAGAIASNIANNTKSNVNYSKIG
jgi:NCAIR mutase (PurE)-related protein